MSERIIKVLKNKKWIITTTDFDNLNIGDVIRYYDSEEKIIINKSGLSEVRKIEYFYFKENPTELCIAEFIFLSEILSLQDAKLFIKSLIGKYANCIGRYQFRRVYTNLYNYLKEIGIDIRKRPKSHIDYLTREELIECEDFLRYCITDMGMDISDLLEKYGLLADEVLF